MDLEKLFDEIDHDWLLRMIRERIDNAALLNLISKWLKAGILDTDGKIYGSGSHQNNQLTQKRKALKDGL